ncbi:MAG: hypothetical protein AB7Q29_10120 [Vicinamibacterales bacterium]
MSTDGPHAARLTRAYAALDAAATRDHGLQLTIGDATLQRSVRPSHVRALLWRQGIELGFDAGPELFSTMLALRLCGSLAPLPNLSRAARRFAKLHDRGRFDFFIDPNTHPRDTDTTSVAAAALFEAGAWSAAELHAAAAELPRSAFVPGNPEASPSSQLLGLQDVLMVYWLDRLTPGTPLPRHGTFDAVAAVNGLYALALAESLGQVDGGAVIAATEAFVEGWAESAAFLGGTLYYPSPDAFLCFLALLCERFPRRFARLTRALSRALRTRVRAIDGGSPALPGSLNSPAAPPPRGSATAVLADPASAINLAHRLIAADVAARIADERIDAADAWRHRLLSLQSADGSWPAGPLYAFGTLPLYAGSPALTTSFAVRALGWTVADDRRAEGGTQRVAG